MNTCLHNKKGVTVLEGVIALGLLAIVTAGSFGVLLATSRQATQPTMREEMALAVEKANDKLKAYLVFVADDTKADLLPGSLENGLCGEDDDPFQNGVDHDIRCMLPPICDPNSSEFKYRITQDSSSVHGDVEAEFNTSAGGTLSAPPALYQITYTISCNGYQL